MDKSCQTCANYTETCKKCVSSQTFSEYTPLGGPVIKDSGERREFETGAVRDIQEGKGRCDLLPLMQVAKMIGEPNEVIRAISLYQTDGGVGFLKKAITYFLEEIGWTVPHAMLEVSKHFEAGC